MNRRSPQSMLLLFPEAGSAGPVSGEKPKIKRYRLVRVRVNPPMRGDRVRPSQALLDPFLGGQM